MRKKVKPLASFNRSGEKDLSFEKNAIDLLAEGFCRESEKSFSSC